jgi:hypothetical protein
MTDLWPEDFGKIGETPPGTILREQAQALSRKTKGLLEGLVNTSNESDRGFLQQFFLVVPLLDNYTYCLLLVRHPLQLYPVELTVAPTKKTVTCKSAHEFRYALKANFASEEVRFILRALLAQAQDLAPPPYSMALPSSQP